MEHLSFISLLIVLTDSLGKSVGIKPTRGMLEDVAGKDTEKGKIGGKIGRRGGKKERGRKEIKDKKSSGPKSD